MDEDRCKMYLGKDEATLKDMLDSCGNFKERQKIRNALREVQGLNRQFNGGIQPLSFRPRNVKFEDSSSKQPSTSVKELQQNTNSLIVKQETKGDICVNLDEKLSTDVIESNIKTPNDISLSLETQQENTDIFQNKELLEQNILQSSVPEPLITDKTDDNFTSKSNLVTFLQNDLDNFEFSNSDILKSSSPQENCDNQPFSNISKVNGDSNFSNNSHNISPVVSFKEETLKGTHNKPCRFFIRGKITSNIPKSAIKSQNQSAKESEEMEGPVKSYRSQLIIGSIGNPKAKKCSYQSHVFINDAQESIEKLPDNQNEFSGNQHIRRCNSLRVLKKSQLHSEQDSHDGGSRLDNHDGETKHDKHDIETKHDNYDCGTKHDNHDCGTKHDDHDAGIKHDNHDRGTVPVITEEIRGKSLDQNALSKGQSSSSTEYQKGVMNEIKHKSLDQSSLSNEKKEDFRTKKILTDKSCMSHDQTSFTSGDTLLNNSDFQTIVSDKKRNKSLDQTSLINGDHLLNSKDAGTIITKKIRRRSLDQCSPNSAQNQNYSSENENTETADVSSLSRVKEKEEVENECGLVITDKMIERSLAISSIDNYIKPKCNSEDKKCSVKTSKRKENTCKDIPISDQDEQAQNKLKVTENRNIDEQKCSDIVNNENEADDNYDDLQKKELPVLDHTEEELSQQLQGLQTQLKECTDFTQRRKIRGRIRKLREQIEAFGLRQKPDVHQFVESCTRVNGVSREIIQISTATSATPDYRQVDSKDELRKLLSQTNDYEEKKQIRLALRQLRQRDRERENSETRSGPTTTLTRSQSAKDFNGISSTRPQIVRCTSVISNSDEDSRETGIDEKPLHLDNGYINGLTNAGDDTSVHFNHDLRQSGRLTPENHLTKHSNDSDESSLPSPLQRSFSLNSLRRKGIGKDKKSVVSEKSSNIKSVHSNSPESCSSSSEFSEHSQDNFNHSRELSKHSKTGNNSQNLLKHSKDSSSVYNTLSDEKHSTDLEKSRRSSVPASAKPFKDSEDYKSGSESDSSSCRDWLEKKRRNSLTVIDTKKLNSTMDIEAAFSEILNAVETEEENNNEEDDAPELEITEVNGQEKISIKTPRNVSDKAMSTVDINFNNNEVKTVCNEEFSRQKDEELTSEVQLTPVKERPVLTFAPTSPLNDSLSVIEDEDGSITVQSVSYKDQGDHTVTEKTTLRRSQSRTEEEEKDTVIETKITSPGGSDHFEKDVIRTKRKITSRGSDYYSRSQYKSKWLRNKEGETIEEHDVMVESDNFSATKGQAWGDRSEAKVQLNKPSLIPNPVVPEIQERTSQDSGENQLQVHGPNRMDVSKASSGYGSVSGSDEEEKEETVTTTLQGKPSGSPEIKAALKDLVTLEGSNAVLECMVTCSPQPDITWYKGDKSLMNNRHFEPKFDIISGRAMLTVVNCTKDDSGPYKCVFRNPLGEAETKAALTVRSRAKKKPTFTKPLKNMVATEGHSVCLECTVNDATQVSWYKDGIIQRNTSDFKQTFDGLNAKLEIDEIFVDDHGEYACVAKNDFGENKTTCKINVKETACETDVVPMFLTKPESKIHECEDTIILQCDVIGSPQPTITWCRDQQTVENSRRHKQTYDGRTAVLLITNATVEDSGKYECIAINTSGKVSVDGLIVVKARQSCPEIMTPLTDETATCGKSLTLKCDVKGNPTPMIVWRKDSRIIGNTKDFQQTYQDVTAKLQICDVHREDAGCYECVARNVHGAVTSKCSVTVDGTNSKSTNAEQPIKKPFDWLVGRDKNEPAITENKPKDITVKRSESMKISSNSLLRDKYRKSPLADSSIQEVAKEPSSKVTVTKDTTDIQVDNNVKVDINMNKTKFEDPLKQKAVLPRSKGPEDPPWKNVTLRRTESARAPVGRRESPFLRKRKEELEEKMDVISPSQNTEDPAKLVTKPPGWRPVVNDRKEPDINKENEILSSLKQVNLCRSDSARCLREEGKLKSSNVDTNERESGSKTEDSKTNKKVEDESPKIGQTSSTRLLFERKLDSDKPVDTQLSNFLNRPGSGLRRTSSLKITQAERDAGTKPTGHSRINGGLDLEHSQGARQTERRFGSKEGDQRTTTTMPSYDNIDDEEELHKILSKTDDFEERKKIRNRMRELREKKSKEMEEKRLQREKETEDIFKKKFQAAEEEQKRQMKAFEKAAQETKEEREKILKVKDDILKESIKAQDEAKKRQLEAFDKMAQKGGEGKVTQQAGFGGAVYTKTPAQPAGAKGAMNKFKEMDTPPAGGAKPNFAAGRGGGRPVTRSPSAIKEMLLNWTKAMTAGYENVDVQNFSSSWNNGMAFCALIHHFYPDAFDFSKLDPKKRRANFQLAFDMAEKHADIAPLLDVEDMVKMQKPDWKCVFTYVQSFYRKLNDHPRNSAGAPKSEQ